MEQNGRKAYEMEIAELREKTEKAENALAWYDECYAKFYAAMPKKVSRENPGPYLDRAVQRAINDAYMQWKEDTGL